MDSLIVGFVKNDGSNLSNEDKMQAKQVFEPLFIFSIVKSIGASCDNDGRIKYDTYMRVLISQVDLKEPPPNECSLFGARYNIQTFEWEEWFNTIPTFKCDPNQPFAELIVPTVDSIGYKYVVHHLIMIFKHILCVGETGTGKTLIVRDKMLKYLRSTIYTNVHQFFSSDCCKSNTRFN
jgi:dynein heavy chain